MCDILVIGKGVQQMTGTYVYQDSSGNWQVDLMTTNSLPTNIRLAIMRAPVFASEKAARAFLAALAA